ncbi:MAG: cell division protein FtsQ [Rhodospirillaceae bacterium]|nr:MAG: cell division protein FtsQ [Rhodospirillaceae bacterium]
MRRVNRNRISGKRAWEASGLRRPKVALWSLVRACWRRRLLMGGIGGAAVIVLAGGGTWLWATNGMERMRARVGTELTELSTWMGFRLDDIRVTGRVRTPAGHILTALRLKRGESLFLLDVQETKRRLEALPWVRVAVVERRLPDMVRLSLVERQVVALWQREGRHVLIDAEGTEVMDDIKPFRHLPIVVGEKAPSQVGTLLALVRSQPTLAPRVRAAQLVSGRRWNLRLDDVNNGIDARLPEENPAEALQHLVDFDREHGLLRRRLVMVDLRIPDRLVVRLEGSGQQEQVIPTISRKPGRDA